MKSINIHAAKTNLSQLLQRVEKGEKIVISRNGKPLADLIPHREAVAKKRPRRGGQWTGKIRYAADYDKVDAAIRKSFEDSEIFPEDGA